MTDTEKDLKNQLTAAKSRISRMRNEISALKAAAIEDAKVTHKLMVRVGEDKASARAVSDDMLDNKLVLSCLVEMKSQ